MLLWIDADEQLQGAATHHLEAASIRARAAGPIERLLVPEQLHRFRHPHLFDQPSVGLSGNYFRLEVVHLYGGIYMDTDTVAVRPFDDFGDTFRHPFVVGEENLCNCMLGLGRHSPFARYMLDVAQRSCSRSLARRPSYVLRKPWQWHGMPAKDSCAAAVGAGNSPMFLTGAFTTYRPDDVMVVSSVHLLDQRPPHTSITYQTFDGVWNPTHLAFKSLCVASGLPIDCRAAEQAVRKPPVAVSLTVLLLAPLLCMRGARCAAGEALLDPVRERIKCYV